MIDKKIHALCIQRAEDSAARELLEEASKHIDKILPKTPSTAQHTDQAKVAAHEGYFLSRQMTLENCEPMLKVASSDLNDCLREVNKELQALSLHEDAAEREALLGGKESVEKDLNAKVLGVIKNSKSHIFRDVYAAQGAFQVITTSENPISANGVTAGPRATQVLGHMADTTLRRVVAGSQNGH
jgi:hypothetical protein